MKRLISIALLAVALAAGYSQAYAKPPTQIPQNTLRIVGVEDGNLVMLYRALPSRFYVLQGTRDFMTWEDIIVFRPHDAAHPTVLEVPTDEGYMFFRVKVSTRRGGVDKPSRPVD